MSSSWHGTRTTLMPMTPTRCTCRRPRTASTAGSCASTTRRAYRCQMTTGRWPQLLAYRKLNGHLLERRLEASSNHVAEGSITSVVTRNSTKRIHSRANAPTRLEMLPRKDTEKQDVRCYEHTASMCRAWTLSCSTMLPDQTREEKKVRLPPNPLAGEGARWMAICF